MVEEIFEKISQELPVKPGDINSYSPLALAYVGDAVYELYIRTLLLSRGNAPVHKLHRQSVAFVKAKAQSDIVHKLMERLDPVEQDVVRRGRNAKSGTIPKNADVADYKYATGFETLLGYLYIKQDFARLLEVMRISVEQSEADV
ncbi:MAG TPA: ribonuclease III domain-containing protein [Clostridiales bacterium]|nr:ribonuclease III domain-containing protein [Clostridiales bacterium]HPP36390.1 ribonuclease III domain-containing protein [Clostridiales bacterium]